MQAAQATFRKHSQTVRELSETATPAIPRAYPRDKIATRFCPRLPPLVGQCLVDDRPRVIEQPRLRGCIWMDSVLLHQLIVQCYALHKKLDPWHVILCGYFAKNVFKCLGIALSVTWRNADAEQNDVGTGGPATGNNPVKISLDARGWKPPEPVVSAQLKDNKRGFEGLDCGLDTCRTAFSCFSAYAGVDDSMFVPLLLKPRLQQCRPGLVNIYTVTRTQAVAENKYRWYVGGAGRMCEQRNNKDKYSKHELPINRQFFGSRCK